MTNNGDPFKHSFVAGFALAISSPMTIVWWTGVFGALLASQGSYASEHFRFFLLPFYFTGLLPVGVFSGCRAPLGEKIHQ